MNQIQTQDLLQWLDQTLESARFKDYCPNGLQVEGRPVIRRLVSGVTASEALLRAAVERGADGVLVHHGWFWRNEDARIRGMKKRRIALAIEYDLNLLAYHLPLDAHPVLGNNAQLAHILGLEPDRHTDGAPQTCGPDNLIWLGQAPGIDTIAALEARIVERLQRPPVIAGDRKQAPGRIAWCTGGAQGFFEAALEAGARTFITGEISEPSAHIAAENGATFISAGHHATERYGVQALGQAIAGKFGIQVEFIDLPNPA